MKNLIKNRITIIAGHYGTGKTNIAVNLAESIAKSGKKACIVDLDIVNPYFRSADNVKELNKLGVRTIVPQYANTNVDIPSLPQEYYSIFSTDEYSIVDVGGDADGAVALAVDYDKYEKNGYTMYFVYNKYRPMIAKPENAYALIQRIEQSSHLSFSGIINNSNLGAETTAEIVIDSFPYADKLSELSGLPISAATALGSLNIKNTCKIKNITKQLF